MMRRDFGKASLGIVVSAVLGKAAIVEPQSPSSEFPHASSVTEYVARFVIDTKYEAIPEQVVELGKKSILDGFGLALAGSRANMGSLSRRYIADLEICKGSSPIVGSSQRTASRFSALANGISIHA